jgi:starch-binding outer membrane protein, SusD/RagB family
MPRLFERTAVAGCLALAAAGCSDFLTADKATKDPNLPTAATRDQLFIGVQANIFAEQEGPLAMIVCRWMQQCSGVNGRFVQTEDNYGAVNAANTWLDPAFREPYSAGGLIALRTVEASADADGDKVYLGIAQVLEALLIGTTADVWGSIPYSEAVAGNPTPAFDDQMQVYAALQTLLDQAITNIGGAGSGPALVDDLFFGTTSGGATNTDVNRKAQWIQVARTLKARFHMHTAERLGAAAYTAARTAALQGIGSDDNTLRTTHTSATSERNMWRQFQITSGFGLDLVAGKRLVDLMLADNDPRLPEYFGRNRQGGFGGNDVTTGSTLGEVISPIAGSERDVDNFRQPIVTWEENQLILAEANYQLAGGGAAGMLAAQSFLDAVRAAHGKGSKPATLQAIMEEKYIAMFQTIEVWSDWRRTCFPRLTPALGRAAVPGRLPYGQTEAQTNPDNIPLADENLFTVRNPNDPNGCPTS